MRRPHVILNEIWKGTRGGGYVCLGSGGGAGDVLRRWKEGEGARYDRAGRPHAARDGAASAARDGRGLTNRGLGERLGIAFRAQKPRIGPVTRSFFELLDLLRLRGHDGDR